MMMIMMMMIMMMIMMIMMMNDDYNAHDDDVNDDNCDTQKEVMSERLSECTFRPRLVAKRPSSCQKVMMKKMITHRGAHDGDDGDDDVGTMKQMQPSNNNNNNNNNDNHNKKNNNDDEDESYIDPYSKRQLSGQQQQQLLLQLSPALRNADRSSLVDYSRLASGAKLSSYARDNTSRRRGKRVQELFRDKMMHSALYYGGDGR
jgi:hypothetical protein